MKYYAEWGHSSGGDHWHRSPVFGSLDDLKEYLQNAGVKGARIYCDE